MVFSNHHVPFGCMGNLDKDHDELTERLRKTLYYGKLPGTDRPSLPLTDIAVEFFQEAAPKPLGKLDPYLAASTSRSACMSAEAVMVGMMYVRRLRQRKPEYLTQISSSELFLISMMMASKFLYDEGVDEEVFNDEWAESGDAEVEDVNQLELDFLSAIDWQLFVRPDEFAEMLDNIEKRIAHRQGSERGWFTYTDLCVLTLDPKLCSQWSKLLAELSKVVCVSSMAYLAGFLTLVGSTALGTSVGASMVTLPSTLLSQLAPVHKPDPESLHANLPVEPLSMQNEHPSDLMGSRADPRLHNASSPTGAFSALPDPRPQLEASLVKAQTGQCELSTCVDAGYARRMEQQENEGRDTVNKEKRPLINGLVSSVLTLLTLKETLVSFVSAIYNEQPNPNTTWDSSQSMNDNGSTDRVEVCSDGACMLESWPGCWNVSSEHDWSAFKSNVARDAQRQSGCNVWRNQGLNLEPLSPDSPAGDWGGRQKCCCRLDHLTTTHLHTPLYPAHVDVGFATGSALPSIIAN